MKKFIVVMLVLSFILITNLVETRKSKKSKIAKKRLPEAAKNLPEFQKNKLIIPKEYPKHKLSMVKGVSETFLHNLGFSDIQISKLLRVSVKNVASLMHNLHQFVKGQQKLEEASKLITLLNTEEMDTTIIKKAFNDKDLLKKAIQAIKTYFAPRSLPKKPETKKRRRFR